MRWWRKVEDLLEIDRRRVHLLERIMVGLNSRYNDAVVRNAIVNGEQMYLQIRKSDGFVLCNNAARPSYYSHRYVTEHPAAAALTMEWLEVDPYNPLDKVEQREEDGCWYILER